MGVGVVLSQGEEEDYPIAYFSQKLLEREQNYSTIEKECLGVVLGIKAFEVYLLGCQSTNGSQSTEVASPVQG